MITPKDKALTPVEQAIERAMARIGCPPGDNSDADLYHELAAALASLKSMEPRKPVNEECATTPIIGNVRERWEELGYNDPERASERFRDDPWKAWYNGWIEGRWPLMVNKADTDNERYQAMKTESPAPAPAPLVSNEDLGSNMNVYEASLEKHTSHDVVTRLNMTTAYGAGARNMRDIYESELTKMRAERDELVGAMELIASAKDRGFGIDYARGMAESLLSKYKAECEACRSAAL